MDRSTPRGGRRVGSVGGSVHRLSGRLTTANRSMLLDPVMLELCGDVRGKRALDIGCGEGRFWQDAGDHRAGRRGIDITPTLIRTAHERQAAHAKRALMTARIRPAASYGDQPNSCRSPRRHSISR